MIALEESVVPTSRSDSGAMLRPVFSVATAAVSHDLQRSLPASPLAAGALLIAIFLGSLDVRERLASS